MPFDPEHAREYLALAGSLVAVASTTYFWLVRANRERAMLSIHPIGDLRGTAVMPMEDIATCNRVAVGDGQLCIKYWTHLVIVNNSSLPNALLGARIWIMFADGQWREMDVHHEEIGQDAFPLNVDPLTTSSLKLGIATAYPGSLNGTGFADRERMAGDALPRRIPVRIELQALRNQRFGYEYLDSGDGLSRTDAPVAGTNSTGKAA